MSSELPALRAVNVMPVDNDGEQVFVVEDPRDLLDEPLVLNPLGGWLLQFYDGRHRAEDVRELMRDELEEPVPENVLDELTEVLDDHLLLDNDRFARALEEVRQAFLERSDRPASLPGSGLPETPPQTSRFLDEVLNVPEPPSDVDRAEGFVIPHIDFERGHSIYQTLVPHLRELNSPERFVVLGVSHQVAEKPFALTSKNYGTALGTVTTDTDTVSRLQNRLPYTIEEAEMAHRGEHSVEIPLTLIQYALPERDFQVIPVICSYHHNEEPAGRDAFNQALEEELRDPDTYLVAGVDFAHVGPQFGDPDPVDGDTLSRVEKQDQKLIDHLEAGHTEGFQNHIQSTDNDRAVCGYPALRTMLPHVESAESVGYDQWEDPGGSVSFGGAVIHS